MKENIWTSLPGTNEKNVLMPSLLWIFEIRIDFHLHGISRETGRAAGSLSVWCTSMSVLNIPGTVGKCFILQQRLTDLRQVA